MNLFNEVFELLTLIFLENSKNIKVFFVLIRKNSQRNLGIDIMMEMSPVWKRKWALKLTSQNINKEELENLGYNLVIYPVSSQRLAMQNVEIGLKSIFKDGHQNNIIDKMQTRKRLYELVEYEKYNTPDKKITDFSTEGHE